MKTQNCSELHIIIIIDLYMIYPQQSHYNHFAIMFQIVEFWGVMLSSVYVWPLGKKWRQKKIATSSSR